MGAPSHSLPRSHPSRVGFHPAPKPKNTRFRHGKPVAPRHGQFLYCKDSFLWPSRWPRSLCVYIYIYIYICFMSTYIYIYIYRERERERLLFCFRGEIPQRKDDPPETQPEEVLRREPPETFVNPIPFDNSTVVQLTIRHVRSHSFVPLFISIAW